MRHDEPPPVSESSPVEAKERQKAGNAGRTVIAFSFVVAAIALIAAVAGQMALAIGGAGAFVAVLVVGLVLYYDRERQRPRASPEGKTPSSG
jgi:hypothetical protein